MPAKKKTSNKKSTKKSTKKQTHKSKTKKTQPILGNGLKIGIAVVAILIILALILIPYKAPNGTGTGEGTVEVVLDMYVMSQCPFGVQAQDGAIPVIQKFGGDVDLNTYFIVQSSGDTFRSLHDQPEVDEDMRQVCIMDEYPDKYLDYLSCFNKGYQNPEVQYANCAGENDIDTTKIKTCFDERGVELLKASEAETAKVGATASPTIYLNGEPYASGRTELDFARAICEKFDYNHEGCADVPKPVEVGLTVLTDDDCPTCDPARIIQVSKQLFPGAVATIIDVDSEEGQALVEKHSLVYLPSYVFDSRIMDTNTWTTNAQIQASFVQSGDGYRIRDEAIGVTWFIDEAKRDEQDKKFSEYINKNLDALGYSQTQATEKPRLDYFVMSFCPYGNPADLAASQVYELLGDKVEIVPYYIVSVEGDKINSLHGEQEGNQGVRELCALRELGMEDFFAFTLKVNDLCGSNNADTCWEQAAEQSGVDAEKIRNCETSSKLEIAQEQSDIISSLQSIRVDRSTGAKTLVSPQASPTFLINGATHQGARDAESLKQALCSEFTNPPVECGEVIAASAQQAAPSGSC